MEALKTWIFESNRHKHMVGGFVVGLFGTILMAIGVASGMELKDSQYGNKWDWTDWVMTVGGGLIGNIIQAIIILVVVLCAK